MMVECGIVKFFDEREGRKYGFIRVLDAEGVETGEEIFFHKNDGMFVGRDGEEAIFKSYHSQTTAAPGNDEEIVFQRTAGKGGKPKASPWAYANEWQEEEALLALEESDGSDDFQDDSYLDEEEEEADIGAVQHRISQWAGGNTELAREAMQHYPGDFI